MEIISSKEVIKGDILLYHGKSPVSKLIRFFDGTEVNHAAVCIGEGQVGEALAQGLVRNAIEGQIKNGEYIVVRRLKNNPETMQPVVDKAEYYLAIGNNYAFNQILLLAFLGLSRKLQVNVYVKWLLRKILDQAADWLTTNGEKQPMICSEFVYRCYNEALPTEQDPYSLNIEPFPTTTAGSRRGIKETARKVTANNIHRDSLLAWVGGTLADRTSPAAETLVRSLKETGPKSLAASQNAEEKKLASLPLDDLITKYLDETRKPGRRSLTSEASLRSPDVLRSIEKFGAALHQTLPKAKKKPASTGKRGLTGNAEVENLSVLVKTAADFVTPGDLLKCIDLFNVGQIEQKR